MFSIVDFNAKTLILLSFRSSKQFSFHYSDHCSLATAPRKLQKLTSFVQMKVEGF